MEKKLKVCLVDDEAQVTRVLALFLRQRKGVKVEIFNDPCEALKFLSNGGSDTNILISDFDMPGMSGLEVYKAAKKVNPKIKTICISGKFYHKDDCIRAGYDLFLEKPLRLSGLWSEICRMI